MKNFYCQNTCGAVDFSIDEWNKAFIYCIENNLSEKQMSEILDGVPCKEQCFDCISIVGETRIKNRKILEEQTKKNGKY